MDFGTRLKKIRTENNISQEELAQKMGIGRSAIANYETNRNMPTAEILNKLADFFQISTDYLLCKTDVCNSEKEKQLKQDILDLAQIGFTKDNYHPLTEKQKEDIKAFLEVFLKENRKDKE